MLSQTVVAEGKIYLTVLLKLFPLPLPALKKKEKINSISAFLIYFIFLVKSSFCQAISSLMLRPARRAFCLNEMHSH